MKLVLVKTVDFHISISKALVIMSRQLISFFAFKYFFHLRSTSSLIITQAKAWLSSLTPPFLHIHPQLQITHVDQLAKYTWSTSYTSYHCDQSYYHLLPRLFQQSNLRFYCFCLFKSTLNKSSQ